MATETGPNEALRKLERLTRALIELLAELHQLAQQANGKQVFASDAAAFSLADQAAQHPYGN